MPKNFLSSAEIPPQPAPIQQNGQIVPGATGIASASGIPPQKGALIAALRRRPINSPNPPSTDYDRPGETI